MQYSLDGRQALRRDYIAKTSMDNFLTQLGTAMNGTWTSTWNESNQAYDFTFIPNTSNNTSNIENETDI